MPVLFAPRPWPCALSSRGPLPGAAPGGPIPCPPVAATDPDDDDDVRRYRVGHIPGRCLRLLVVDRELVEFDDDFEEEENDPDWDHPDEGDDPPPPDKGGRKK